MERCKRLFDKEMVLGWIGKKSHRMELEIEGTYRWKRNSRNPSGELNEKGKRDYNGSRAVITTYDRGLLKYRITWEITIEAQGT